jgi:hypothetical protein
MTVQIASGATLTTFGETRIAAGGQIQIQNGAQLDAQFINIEEGTLSGGGEIFVGTGPIHGAVRNLAGRIEPGDGIGRLSITGDLSNLAAGTLAMELGGLTPETEYDVLELERYAFLAGTLEIDLTGGFFPSEGDTFTLLEATAGVVGQFDQLVLPSGYQWDIQYLANTVVLEVTGIGTIPGDFDQDGDVDADDLATWQTGYAVGSYDGGDFLLWQRSYTGPGALATASAVPEPSSLLLGLLACGSLLAHRQKQRAQQ